MSENLAIVATAIGLGLTIVGVFWKIFTLYSEIGDKIDRIDHRLELLEQELEMRREMLGGIVNQIKEMVEHVRQRSMVKEAELSAQLNALENKVAQIEGWLDRNTEYQRRRSRHEKQWIEESDT